MTEPFDEFREPTLLDVVHDDEAEVLEPDEDEFEDDGAPRLDELVDVAEAWLDSLPTEYSGDRDWYEFCLKTMARASGLDDDTMSTDVAVLLMDTCAVAAITHEFHHRIDSGGPSGDWRYIGVGPDLADGGGLYGLFVGRAAEHCGIDVTIWDTEDANMGWLVELYVEEAWSRVLSTLTDELGDNGVFVGLWGARCGADDPLGDGTWEILNAPSTDALVGWEWMQNDGASPG